MKLAAHYNKASILITLTVLFAGAVIYFFAINYFANKQLDRNLTQGLAEAEEYLKTTGTEPQQYDLDQDHAVFIKTDRIELERRYFDTTYHNYREDRMEAGRAVEDLCKARGANYKVTITVSRENTKYLVEMITLITLALMAGLLVVLFITNKYILNGLWKPFHHTLKAVKDFNLADSARFSDTPSKVEEFTELNLAIHEMANRVRSDYQQLKEFTENASHELMTPLAVVTTKLDTLIQDETLRPDQLSQITDIYASISKSTRLNQSLLLLSKLDHQMIRDEENINLKITILEKILQFQELIKNREIVIQHQLSDKYIHASKFLVDILLNNLFSNAIRHNLKFGTIHVTLTNEQLIVANSSSATKLPANQLFGRFQKGKESQGSGLGLSIIQNICRQYHFELSYQYQDELHMFIIFFR